MKKWFLYLSLIFLSTSCIQEEALNAEADILSCVINNEEGKPDVNIKANVLVTNTQVTALAIPKINLEKLIPVFQVTPGATITPESGVIRDFSKPQQYTVTSEDGKWQKVYIVSVDTSEMATRYEFENVELTGSKDNKYQAFYEIIPTSAGLFKQYIWASGNAGFALTGVAKSPEEFPTISYPIGSDKTGNVLKVTTKSTGSFGEFAGMPIAAGNLFIGSFNAANAMKEPLKATLFGLPFGKKPVALRGSYKFKGGAPFIIKGKNGKKEEVPGKEDIGDIYAVLYDAEKGSLAGDNILTSDQIIALARVKDMKSLPSSVDIDGVGNYTDFNVVFDYDSYHASRPFDRERLKEYKYNLAVVFTSSRDGAYFAGALGSTLCVDNVEVICE